MDDAQRWDVFCHVVDNYGDIGVCWRLARQLAGEHGRRVRLWVDDLAAFRRINPRLDPGRAEQCCDGVVVRHWCEPFPPTVPADVVIEAFGCGLPQSYLRAMVERPAKPCWINLEYLSAEDWVGECHGLPSPSPRLPLVRYFFFPGFAAETGGLLCEADLDGRRRAWQEDAVAQAAFWAALGLAPAQEGEVRISLFCYPQARAEDLFACWQQEPAVTCLVPEGVATASLAAFFGVTAPAAGALLRRGGLEVRVLPFLAQDDYDRLLWSCDWNFVRGEDSFVRAQWALRPLVWQPYPQDDQAHLRKLEAFLRRYCAGMAAETAAAVQAGWRAWCLGEGLVAAWPALRRQGEALAQHAQGWAAQLRRHGDLAANLVRFCRDKL